MSPEITFRPAEEGDIKILADIATTSGLSMHKAGRAIPIPPESYLVNFARETKSHEMLQPPKAPKSFIGMQNGEAVGHMLLYVHGYDVTSGYQMVISEFAITPDSRGIHLLNGMLNHLTEQQDITQKYTYFVDGVEPSMDEALHSPNVQRWLERKGIVVSFGEDTLPILEIPPLTS